MTRGKLRMINFTLFIASALAFAHGYEQAILGFFAMGYVTRMVEEEKL